LNDGGSGMDLATLGRLACGSARTHLASSCGVRGGFSSQIHLAL
jgi:hypothetical protein